MGMKEKTQLGVCYTSGQAIVDYAAFHELGVDNTVVHEFIHKQLFDTTYYGMFLQLLTLVSQIDKDYLGIVQILSDNMIKTQEAVATFIEYNCYYKINGMEKFQQKIKDLKRYNKDYYNYVHILEFLFNEKRITFDEKVQIVLCLAYATLSIDLTEIDIKIMKSKNKLNKFIINQNNNNKFLPTTRFKLLVKDLKNYLNENKNIQSQKINDIILHNSNIISFTNEEKSIKNIVDYIKKLVEDSKFNIKIKSLFSNIKIIQQEKSLLGICIQPLNPYESEELLYKEYIKINRKVPSVALVSINFDKNKVIDVLSQGYMKNIDVTNGYTAVFMNFEYKKNYYIKDLSLEYIINDDKNIKLIDIVSYLFYEDKINSFIERINKKVYIISTISYDVISLYFDKFIARKYKFRHLLYEKFLIIVVYITDNIKLIIPMEHIAYLRFLEDLKNSKCKFEVIDSDGYDEFIFRNEDDVDIYNIIMNSYLQT